MTSKAINFTSPKLLDSIFDRRMMLDITTKTFEPVRESAQTQQKTSY